MANFNVNQVRQLYVAKTAPQLVEPDDIADIATTLGNPGDFAYSSLDGDDCFYFVSRGATGDLVRSDLINAKSIKHVTYLDKTNDVYGLKRTKIQMLSSTNSGNPVVGQDYTVIVSFNSIMGFGIEDTYHKIGVAHAYTGTTAAALLGELAVSLYTNIANDSVVLANVYCGSTLITPAVAAAHVAGTSVVSGNSITIEEVEQPWRRGVMSAIVVPFTVTGQYITVNGDLMPWANITPDTPVTTIKNTKKIADLEYFCMGERGDWYRNVGWPHVIPTSYLVPADSTDANGYNVLTIHYKYIGGGDEAASRLSVKDIQIVSTQSLESLYQAILGYKNGTTESEEGSGEAH